MINFVLAASLLAAAAGPAPATPAAPDFAGWLRAELDRNMRHVAPLRGAAPAGIARVSFRLGADGRPTDVRLAESAGVPALDAEALRAVRAFAPAPAGHPRGTVEAVMQWDESVSPARDRRLARELAAAARRGEVSLAARTRAGGRRSAAR